MSPQGDTERTLQRAITHSWGFGTKQSPGHTSAPPPYPENSHSHDAVLPSFLAADGGGEGRFHHPGQQYQGTAAEHFLFFPTVQRQVHATETHM